MQSCVPRIPLPTVMVVCIISLDGLTAALLAYESEAMKGVMDGHIKVSPIYTVCACARASTCTHMCVCVEGVRGESCKCTTAGLMKIKGLVYTQTNIPPVMRPLSLHHSPYHSSSSLLHLWSSLLPFFPFICHPVSI